MRKSLISAAAIALFTFPALAEPDRDRTRQNHPASNFQRQGRHHGNFGGRDGSPSHHGRIRAEAPHSHGADDGSPASPANPTSPGTGGPRHDFSSFRDFHRNFDASRHFQAPDYRQPAGWYAHRWVFGEVLPNAFWARDYWIVNYADYDLPPPPFGAVWVRVGHDALLVDQESGEIVTVEYGVFY